MSRRIIRNLSLILALCALCLLPTVGSTPSPTYINPVLAGDYPDPSVIRVGHDYWATATTSQWAPLFPILHSRDLVNWNIVGAAMHKRPAWSDGRYWAPEMSEFNGRYFIYYSARKKDGPLCVAVAVADRPEGPYEPDDPLVCQKAGSIDAMTLLDEHGSRYLIWKEDGNSAALPSIFWAQPLSTDGRKLIGTPTELLRNDVQWEGDVVEGPFLLQRDGWFYLFYSGNTCCGRQCRYALGVARASRLLGPWEKNPANPILTGNDVWHCPGHGSVVTDPQAHTYLLYHAYHSRDSVHVGRQMLLDEVNWGEDDWPTINAGKGPSRQAASPTGTDARNVEYYFNDQFIGPKLEAGWQWPHAREPLVSLTDGWLNLIPATGEPDDPTSAVLSRTVTRSDWTATTAVDLTNALGAGSAGLSAYGNTENALGIAAADGKVMVWLREHNQQRQIASVNAPLSTLLYLRIVAREGTHYQFGMSTDGKIWQDVSATEGDNLPPWDLAVRVSLTASGAGGRFDYLSITPNK